MPTSRKTRRLPGITSTLPVQPTISRLIDTCVSAPRCTMDDRTATRQMASDMREASQREGGIDEAGLLLLGFTGAQIARLAAPARELADRLSGSTPRAELIEALVKVQNHPAFNHQDIMSITGLMSDDEVQLHLDACRQRSEAVAA